MRTTMNTVFSQIQGNLNRLTTDINKLNNQVSSGSQMSTISDNPLNLTGALNLRTIVSELDQYTTNINQGNNIIGVAESTLSQLKEIGSRGKLLATQALGPAVGTTGMAAMATEIKNLLGEAVILGNTQVAGKYIFGGFRTNRYTDAEPAPFIQDKGNGYWLNGANLPALGDRLTSTIPSTAPPLADLGAGDLLLNGVDIAQPGGILTPIILTPPAPTFGVNMAAADSLTTAINASTTTPNVAATAATADTSFTFDLNGAAVAVTVPNGSNSTTVATLTVAAINAQSLQTGVSAVVGDGTNGGVVDSVVFKNGQTGNSTAVTLANLTILPAAAAANPGFGNASQVSAALTTLYASGAATAAAADTTFTFEVNGYTVNVNLPVAGSTPTDVAQRTVAAINAISTKSGVAAVVGDGTNGGIADSVIFRNSNPGDPAAITVANLTILPPASIADPGFGNFSQAADATHNTGELSLSSPNAITISTANVLQDDTFLNALGLGGGGRGFQDTANDGLLVFGRPLNSTALKINNLTLPATTADGLSTKFADSSAAAKATAINAMQAQTNVTAEIIPASTIGFGAVTGGTESSRLTGALTDILPAGIAAGALAINDIPLGAIPGVVDTDGLYMGNAFDAKNIVNQAAGSTGVTATLTTLVAGAAGIPDFPDLARIVSFTLNGIDITATVGGGGSAAATATTMITAINALSQQTGVQAFAGDGTNGGVADAIILKNLVPGDESPITIAGLPAGPSPAASALLGLSDLSQTADATHNTGEISFRSATPFTISSPTTIPRADTVLNQLGLSSEDGLGTLSYGSTPSYLGKNDLVINGHSIFAIPTAIQDKDKTNVLVQAINEQTAATGVLASRNAFGALVLTATDGRNIEVQTTSLGESITHLNGGDRQDLVHFGSIQLKSLNKFTLESPLAGVGATIYESGLEALGLSGGQTITEEETDLPNDGRIEAFTVRAQTGSVRFAGDRNSDLEIKIGTNTTLTINENGQKTIADSGVFTTLQQLQDSLLGLNFTEVTGFLKATDTTVPLNSRTTGLEPTTLLPTENLFRSGKFTVAVMDHAYEPPRTSAMEIGVEPDVDTLETIAQRLNGVPHLTASWNAEGQLAINTNDPQRYTFDLVNDSSNFLEATGTSSKYIQQEALQKSLTNFDTLANNLSNHISNLGARSNRVQTQTESYANLILATKENLSELQDTDIIKAIMDLQAKQVGYQAALSVASKTMKLSLVDYL